MKLLRGFLFSTVETAESGRPVAVFIRIGSILFLGPDGKTYDGFGGIRGQGTGGDRNLVPTIPRNSITAPSNYKLDLRVTREIHIRENMRAEVLVESFNLFNRSSYNGFNTTIYSDRDLDLDAAVAADPFDAGGGLPGAKQRCLATGWDERAAAAVGGAVGVVSKELRSKAKGGRAPTGMGASLASSAAITGEIRNESDCSGPQL
jgi:hypothetical protein